MALHCQRRTERIIGPTPPIVVALWNRAIGAEAAPELTAIAGGIPTAAALNGHAWLIVGGNAPLAFTLSDRIGDRTLQDDTFEVAIVNPAVALPVGFANRRGVVVLWAAVVTEVHLGGGIGVGEPAGGVAPAEQQRQIQGLGGGVAQGPHEHRHRIAGALVIARQNRTEGLATHLGVIHALIVRPAQRITGGISAGAVLRRTGGIPVPGLEWFTALRA